MGIPNGEGCIDFPPLGRRALPGPAEAHGDEVDRRAHRDDVRHPLLQEVPVGTPQEPPYLLPVSCGTNLIQMRDPKWNPKRLGVPVSRYKLTDVIMTASVTCT